MRSTNTTDRCSHQFANSTVRAFSQRKRFIVVAISDDDSRTRLASALREEDFVVVDAQTGGELLGLLGPAMLTGDPKSRPDVLVVDAELEGTTGAAIACSLRQQGWSTPILMLSDNIDGCFPSALEPVDFCKAVRRACRW